jgi:hypothetical protein
MVRDFKEKAQDHKKVMSGVTMREIKRMQQGGLVPQLEAILGIGQSPPLRKSLCPTKLLKKSSKKMIDTDMNKFEEVIKKSLEDLEGVKK